MANKTLFLVRDTSGVGLYLLMPHDNIAKNKAGNWYDKNDKPIQITHLYPNEIEQYLPDNLILKRGEGPIPISFKDLRE